MSVSLNRKSSHSRQGKRSSRRTSSGGSSSKKRDLFRSIKQFFWLGLYGVIMIVSVRKMMSDELMYSFWYDLFAFGLLWIYRALASAKITKVFRIRSQWFVAHAAVILSHLAVVLFFNEPNPVEVIQSNQIQEEVPATKNGQLYDPNGE